MAVQTQPIRPQRSAGQYVTALTLALLALAGALLLWQLKPLDVPHPDQASLVIGGEAWETPPFLDEAGRIFLPLAAVKARFDPHITWDAGTQRVTVTTRGRVIQMAADSLTALVNREPVELNTLLTLRDGVPYVDADLLLTLYGLEARYHQVTGVVTVDPYDTPVQTGTVLSKQAALRDRPSRFAARAAVTAAGDTVRIYDEGEGWYFVRTHQGRLGYLPKAAVRLGEIVAPVRPPARDPSAWRPLGEKIVLSWDYIYSRHPNPHAIGPMESLNVISPTWFAVVDGQGTVRSRADLTYVRWAQGRGYRVWALVNNEGPQGFDPAIAKAFLRDPAARERVITQLLIYAQLYQLDGINIDFENVHVSDRDYLTQFMREFTPLAHQQGLTVSIDVTFKSNSEYWSLCYDRAALGQIVDYVAVMAYDQHWATSPVAGSVGDLPWVEGGLKRVLNEVPARKLLLGVPFYTRVWKLDGGKLTSAAYGMDAVLAMLAKHNVTPVYDPRTGQNYATWKDGEAVIRVWLEDETSMRQRIELVHKYRLAGIAAWQRTQANATIWEAIGFHLRRERS